MGITDFIASNLLLVAIVAIIIVLVVIFIFNYFNTKNKITPVPVEPPVPQPQVRKVPVNRIKEIDSRVQQQDNLIKRLDQKQQQIKQGKNLENVSEPVPFMAHPEPTMNNDLDMPIDPNTISLETLDPSDNDIIDNLAL